MEEEDNIIVKWAQEDVETSYSLLNKIIIMLIFVIQSSSFSQILKAYLFCSTDF